MSNKPRMPWELNKTPKFNPIEIIEEAQPNNLNIKISTTTNIEEKKEQEIKCKEGMIELRKGFHIIKLLYRNYKIVNITAISDSARSYQRVQGFDIYYDTRGNINHIENITPSGYGSNFKIKGLRGGNYGIYAKGFKIGTLLASGTVISKYIYNYN